MNSSASTNVTGFGEAISVVFSKYATFSGRANRSEYWYFALFTFLVSIVTIAIDFALFDLSSGFTPLNWVWSLVVLLPSLSVGVRRLHDTDRSGWWTFIVLVPFIGVIALLVFFIFKGTEGPNRFG